MRWLLTHSVGRIAMLVVGAYLVVCLLVWIFQRKVMYVPDGRDPPLPQLDGLRDVSFQTKDGLRLRAWVYEPPSPKGTVLLFHGNAANRANRLFWMQQVRAMGYCAFVPDYRGYGGSEGSPTEAGLYLDGEASIAYAFDKLPKPLVLAGTSVGSGVAVEMAVRHKSPGLILTAPLASAVRAGRESFPFLPVGLLLKDRFDNAAKAANIRAPVLILHGEGDRIISIAHSETLFAEAPEPKQFVRLPGVGHNDVWDAPGYWPAIQRFLASLEE